MNIRNSNSRKSLVPVAKPDKGYIMQKVLITNHSLELQESNILLD